MSLLAGLSQQGDSISSHNADPAAHAAHTQAWSTITNTPTTRSGYGITDAQPLDSDLTAIAGLSTTGLVARTGSGTAATRTITGTANQVIVTDGDGVSGNPKLSLSNILFINGTSILGDTIGVNSEGTGNRYASVDLIGDDTYTDYGLRLFRNNTGPNAESIIVHRGTGSLSIRTREAGSIRLSTSDSDRITINPTGVLRFNAYGAGTLVTDSSGNVTASSDGRLKTVTGLFTRGLSDVLKLTPRTYHWNEESGMDTGDENVGFIAQEVLEYIPEAVGQYRTSEVEVDGKKTKKREKAELLTLSDRPLIAALVNAVKELKSENDELRNRIDKLEAKK